MPSRVLYSEGAIASAVKRIAIQITEDFRGQEIMLVCVLRGAFVFAADLLREIERLSPYNGVAACRIEFMQASSYKESTVPGDVEIKLDLVRSLKDQNVILVDDVADTLQTLAYLRAHVLAKGPKVLRTAVLLTKPHKHQRKDVPIDYIGFEGDKEVGFVVGYGMDDAGARRGLPYIVLME